MIRVIWFLLVVLSLLLSFKQKSQDSTLISVVNQSNYRLNNLRVFSHPLDDLSNRDTSKIKFFMFELDKHDAILQFSVEGISFAHYLDPPVNGNCYRYKVKSINLEKKTFGVETMEY